MLQGLLGRDAVSRVVDEYFLQKIPEIFQEWGIVGNDVVQLLHGFDKPTRRSRRFSYWVVQSTPLEVFGGWISAISCHLVDLRDQMAINP